MTKLVVVLAFFLTVVPLICSAAKYSNIDYGLAVVLPDSKKICTTPAPGANHGFVEIGLGDSCDELRSKPRLELFVEYNVSFATTAEDLFTDVCGEPATKTKYLSGGSRIYRCNSRREGGLARQTYFLLRIPNPGESGVVVMSNLYPSSDLDLGNSKRALDLLRKVQWLPTKGI